MNSKLINRLSKITGASVEFTGNIQGVGKLAGIKYDQIDGIGAVPDNRNVVYKGFACIMQASKFLAVVPPRQEEFVYPDFIKDMLEQGTGSPYLDLSFEDEPVPRVMQHEGRGRVGALLKAYGDIPLLVDVFPRIGRARDLTPQNLKDFASNLIVQKTNNTIVKNITNKIYHMGKIIEF